MELESDSFANGDLLPTVYAFGKHHPESHVELAENRSPHLAWTDLPEGTRSLVLVVSDGDVPSKGDDVNQEGKTVPADLPRVDFYHWLLLDIPPDAPPLAEGAFSAGVTPRGKDGPAAPLGLRQGVNDYTSWFAGDPEMGGTYYGYDGPCPPWNDSIVHHYHFTLYALDVDRCPADGALRGADVLRAIEGHVIAQASIMARYTINPAAVDLG